MTLKQLKVRHKKAAALYSKYRKEEDTISAKIYKLQDYLYYKIMPKLDDAENKLAEAEDDLASAKRNN
jgi:hypothetical protein